MRYLMIENAGVAPEEAFTVLGASAGKNGSNIPGLIGTFGSGANMGVLTLLRHGIAPTVLLGNTRLDFHTKPLKVKPVGDNGTENYEQVCVKYGGTSTRTVELSWTTKYGQSDWREIVLALREYVSNAIDAMLMQGVPVKEVWDTIKVEITDNTRAKNGYTRIYVPILDGWRGDEVVKFITDIECWFLHAGEPESLDMEVLTKNARNLVEKKDKGGKPLQRAVFFRRGVRVREFERSTEPSLFDYNIGDLQMNESRTVDDWVVLAAAGKSLKRAKPEVIAQVLRALDMGVNVWEAKVTEYGLSLDDGDDKEAIRKNWAEAVRLVGGDNGLVVSNDMTKELAERKGYRPIKLPAGFVAATITYGLETEYKVLTEDERKGRVVKDANKPLTDTVDEIWDVVVETGMTNGRNKPKCVLFHEHMNAGNEKFGFYQNNTVYVHEDYATARNDALDLTVLEEVAHHCSGATDNSRDFQQWIMRLTHGLMKKHRN